MRHALRSCSPQRHPGTPLCVDSKCRSPMVRRSHRRRASRRSRSRRRRLRARSRRRSSCFLKSCLPRPTTQHRSGATTAARSSASVSRCGWCTLMAGRAHRVVASCCRAALPDRCLRACPYSPTQWLPISFVAPPPDKTGAAALIDQCIHGAASFDTLTYPRAHLQSGSSTASCGCACFRHRRCVRAVASVSAVLRGAKRAAGYAVPRVAPPR